MTFAEIILKITGKSAVGPAIRQAKGEISKEEYERMKKDLEG